MQGPIFAAELAYHCMPYQSTRTRYRSRAERRKETNRRAKLILWFGLLTVAALILKDWRDHWAYIKTFFMD